MTRWILLIKDEDSCNFVKIENREIMVRYSVLVRYEWKFVPGCGYVLIDSGKNDGLDVLDILDCMKTYAGSVFIFKKKRSPARRCG